MRALLDLFLDICLFRKGPQDVPASAILLNFCLLAYIVTSLVVLLITTPVIVALFQVLLDLCLLTGLLHLALTVCRHPRRFEQTLSALTGSGTLISALALPLMIWIVRQGAEGDTVLPLFLLLILMAWSLSVTAHILRHALDISVWVGGVYAIGYTFLSWMLSGWIGQQSAIPPVN